MLRKQVCDTYVPTLQYIKQLATSIIKWISDSPEPNDVFSAACGVSLCINSEGNTLRFLCRNVNDYPGPDRTEVELYLLVPIVHSSFSFLFCECGVIVGVEMEPIGCDQQTDNYLQHNLQPSRCP